MEERKKSQVRRAMRGRERDLMSKKRPQKMLANVAARPLVREARVRERTEK
jgi:hypothetical protein